MARILITEDDPLMLRMYQKVFTLEKYEVDIATNGEEALEKVRANKPTIILLDIMMPKMNGLDALDKLKANPDTQKIPVIMLTNLAGQQDAEGALLKGAIKYIVKSEHEPREVVNMVKEILAASTRDQVPEAAVSADPAVSAAAPSSPAAPVQPPQSSAPPSAPTPQQQPNPPAPAQPQAPMTPPVEIVEMPNPAAQPPNPASKPDNQTENARK